MVEVLSKEWLLLPKDIIERPSPGQVDSTISAKDRSSDCPPNGRRSALPPHYGADDTVANWTKRLGSRLDKDYDVTFLDRSVPGTSLRSLAPNRNSSNNFEG